MRRWVWIVANLANFFSMSCHMSATLLPLYLQESGFREGEIGWLAASFSSAAIATRLGLGFGLERYGRKPFLIVGSLLLNATFGLYGFLEPEFNHWLAIRLIQGIGLACYITAILTWVADQSPPEQIGRLQGVFGVSGLLGSAFGPWLSERVLQQSGFEAMFLTVFGGGILCTLLVLWLPESRPTQGRALLDPTGPITLRAHLPVILVTFPFGWLTGTILTFLAPFVKLVHVSSVGSYFAGFAVASVAVRVFFADAIDRWRPRNLVLLSGGSLALGGLTIASLALFPHTETLIAASLLNGMGHGFLFPGLSTHVVRRTSADQRGAGLALFTGTFDFGILTGALVAGYLAQEFNYSAAFLVAAGLLLASLPTFNRLSRSSEDTVT